jgi:hypothetical protein
VVVERHLDPLQAELVRALAHEGDEAVGRDRACDLLAKALVSHTEQLFVLTHAIQL